MSLVKGPVKKKIHSFVKCIFIEMKRSVINKQDLFKTVVDNLPGLVIDLHRFILSKDSMRRQASSKIASSLAKQKRVKFSPAAS